MPEMSLKPGKTGKSAILNMFSKKMKLCSAFPLNIQHDFI